MNTIEDILERICGSELERVVVYADPHHLRPLLRELACKIWIEAELATRKTPNLKNTMNIHNPYKEAKQ